MVIGYALDCRGLFQERHDQLDLAFDLGDEIANAGTDGGYGEIGLRAFLLQLSAERCDPHRTDLGAASLQAVRYKREILAVGADEGLPHTLQSLGSLGGVVGDDVSRQGRARYLAQPA